MPDALAAEGVVTVEVTAVPGQLIRPLNWSEDRCGMVIARAADSATAERLAAHAAGLIRVRTGPGRHGIHGNDERPVGLHARGAEPLRRRPDGMIGRRVGRHRWDARDIARRRSDGCSARPTASDRVAQTAIAVPALDRSASPPARAAASAWHVIMPLPTRPMACPRKSAGTART
ncbi:hypothetical protein [Micromonospora sp. RTGN7]|uniref:hypothetical protein n=1 Tax=Micromonospora sp. RTGN7 TaxID=3016526 RepID=UPI0039B6F067